MASLNKYGILYLYIGSMEGKKNFSYSKLRRDLIFEIVSKRVNLHVRRTLCKNFLNFEAKKEKK